MGEIIGGEYSNSFRFETGAHELFSEGCDQYAPGGYHPVQYGDLFKDRYVVVRKLGHGSSSTVWLALDQSTESYVALKVFMACFIDTQDQVISAYEKLRDARAFEGNGACLLDFLDVFVHYGPNGLHLCVVSEPMGPPLWSYEEDSMGEVLFAQPDSPLRFPKSLVKLTLRNILSAINVLHANDIFISEDLRPLIKVSGLVSPSHIDPDSTTTRLAGRFQPPELLFGSPLSKAIDIWCFGVFVFELFTSQPMLENYRLVVERGLDRHSRDGHIIMCCHLLGGQLPQELFERWERGRYYLKSDGKTLLSHEDERSTLPMMYQEATEYAQARLAAINLDGSDPDVQEAVHSDEASDQSEEALSQSASALDQSAEAPGQSAEVSDQSAETPAPPVRTRVTSDLHWNPLQGSPTSSDTAVTEYSLWLINESLFRSLETRLAETKQDGVEDSEIQEVLGLLRWILNLDPEKRPSAAEILQHPWFQE
ncbi:SRSF protein kinase 2 [Paramyrothecium foliicola]|nr:SRSF protein kinase 2 [Paramyrothecium foliicola]